MISAPTQLRLPIDLPISRPLIPMKAAVVLLDRSEDEVLALIDLGELTWAWDISSEAAERREVRIWRESLLCHMQNDAGLRDSHAKLPEASVLNFLLPHSGEEIRSTHLQRLFTASQGHIQHLIDQKLLHGLNDPKTGRNGYVRVTRASFLAFMRSRRII